MRAMFSMINRNVVYNDPVWSKVIVGADKEAIRAILELHANNQRQDIWVDRIVSFAIGIISSLFASALFVALKKKSITRQINMERRLVCVFRCAQLYTNKTPLLPASLGVMPNRRRKHELGIYPYNTPNLPK